MYAPINSGYDTYFRKIFRILAPYVGKEHQVQSNLHDNLSLLAHILEKDMKLSIDTIADKSVFEEDKFPEHLD